MHFAVDQVANMRFDAISVLPAMFGALTDHGVVGRALSRELWQFKCWNPRDFATDAYKTIDDRPYGGGPGMVMMAEPLLRTLAAIKAEQQASGLTPSPVVYLSPHGATLTHTMTRRWLHSAGLTLLCGRYEGVDQRLLDHAVDEQVSVGDFVVSGGELPAMLLIDAIVRQLPQVLQDAQSAQQDSFVDDLLDYPHYTRPESLAQGVVPAVLLSGHHRDIAQWRRHQSLLLTAQRRPDLLRKANQGGLLTSADLRFLASQGLAGMLD